MMNATDRTTVELMKRKCEEYEAQIEKLERLVHEKDTQLRALLRIVETSEPADEAAA